MTSISNPEAPSEYCRRQVYTLKHKATLLNSILIHTCTLYTLFTIVVDAIIYNFIELQNTMYWYEVQAYSYHVIEKERQTDRQTETCDQ